VPTHRVEGRSLLPLLHGEEPADWRSHAYSELDYSWRQARVTLGKDVQRCRAFSLRTEAWRYVHWLDEAEQLFDLRADPQEFHDLGQDAGTEAVRAGLRSQLLDFLAARKVRTTATDEQVRAGTAGHKRAGVYFGQW
jgi:arylsulfatase A-like enzyme